MVKNVVIPLLVLTPFMVNIKMTTKEDYRPSLTTTLKENGHYKLESVDATSFGNEFRVYHYDDMVIDEISDNAFSGTNFEILGLTNSVTSINDSVFTNAPNIKTINFTGSKEEFEALNLETQFTNVYYYAIDEGFINYWVKNIRPTAESDICLISRDTYNEVSLLYKNLSDNDLEIVNQYEDLANATIRSSMKELNRLFGTPTPTQKNEEWNQTGAITLIIVIAVIGMTSITIFFLLKTKKFIE